MRTEKTVVVVHTENGVTIDLYRENDTIELLATNSSYEYEGALSLTPRDAKEFAQALLELSNG